MVCLKAAIKKSCIFYLTQLPQSTGFFWYDSLNALWSLHKPSRPIRSNLIKCVINIYKECTQLTILYLLSNLRDYPLNVCLSPRMVEAQLTSTGMGTSVFCRPDVLATTIKWMLYPKVVEEIWTGLGHSLSTLESQEIISSGVAHSQKGDGSLPAQFGPASPGLTPERDMLREAGIHHCLLQGNVVGIPVLVRGKHLHHSLERWQDGWWCSKLYVHWLRVWVSLS